MDELRQSLRVGLKWIWESDHPKGALISHHGIHADGQFWNGRVNMSICPQGYRAGAVVVFNLANRQMKEWADHYELLNPFTKEEIDQLREAVSSCGSEVVDEWNGVGSDTVSFSPARRAGKGVMALVDKYHKGCQRTGKEHRTGSVFCKCGWFTGGEALVDKPEGWY
jgi:hypothetical protein